MNPFQTLDRAKAWGPGSFDMAFALVQAAGIVPGMRVLEVGGGSGYIAATLAKHWNVNVVTLEPWTDGTEILSVATQFGVGNTVLPMKQKAQSLPFPTNSFDAIISIGSFEMIGDERPQALQEMIRVARPGARIGIAEPMCLPNPMPDDLAALDAEHDLQFRQCFRTLDWNLALFAGQGLPVVESYYYPEAYQWWLEYREVMPIKPAEKELILRDQGRWISLGLVVGRKPN
ncbi:MAG TPA: methyltransferase domain-containing protein [Symbiobacteriaceae bacterium]|nr:methyltransferase domain-containing protein [Symbiobacteriaceae bacterium]